MPKSLRVLLILVIACVSSSLWIGISAALHEGHWKAPESAKAVKNPILPDAKTLAEGKELYEKYCQMCHGEKGKGDGAMAAMLKEPPADLTERIGKETDGELAWKISEGRDPMPTFGKKMSKEEIWKTINYARTLVAQKTADK